MATIITLLAVAAAAAAAIINGLGNNSKLGSHKSNFSIEGESIVFHG